MINNIFICDSNLSWYLFIAIFLEALSDICYITSLWLNFRPRCRYCPVIIYKSRRIEINWHLSFISAVIFHYTIYLLLNLISQVFRDLLVLPSILLEVWLIIISSINRDTSRKIFPSKSSIKIWLLFRGRRNSNSFCLARYLLPWWLVEFSLCTLTLSSIKSILLLYRWLSLVLFVIILINVAIVYICMSFYNILKSFVGLMINVVIIQFLCSWGLRYSYLISNCSRSLWKFFYLSRRWWTCCILIIVSWNTTVF